MTHYYKKASPSVPVLLSNGGAVHFERIHNDLGLYKTEDPGTINELNACIQGQRGGVHEITAEVYAELEKKKATSSQRNWRPELGKSAAYREFPIHQDMTARNENENVAAEAEPAAPAPPKPTGQGFRPQPRKV